MPPENRERRGMPRLDQPVDPRRAIPRPHYDPEAFGRVSERIARFIGTGRFLVYMSIFIVVWVTWNIFGPDSARWDEYPFIFLTLILSLQASYAAPLILLAQNRQADRDRVNLDQDRQATLRAREDMEYLAREVAALRIGLGEVPTRDYLRSELRDLLEDLDERRLARPDAGTPDAAPHAGPH
jgi:uncharacterized membrane protein